MNKYKVGDMVEIKKGDRAIIVDFENDEAIIFNLSKMHPGKIKVKDIQKKVCEPNCKVVVEKVEQKEDNKTKEDNKEKEDDEYSIEDWYIEKLETEMDELKDKCDKYSQVSIEILKSEVEFLKGFITELMKMASK